jgi:hypothetical protein
MVVDTTLCVRPYIGYAVCSNRQVLWFSGFIAVAVWNNSGIQRGGEKAKADGLKPSCSTFEYGSARRCKLSTSSVWLGVFLT